MKKITLQTLVICCICFIGLSCSKNQNQFDLELIPVKSGEKWGYINQKGEYVINPQFMDAEFFYDGIAMVKSIDGKVGYISKEGKYIIPAKFKEGISFSEGLTFVVSDGGYPTCIDKTGKTVFQLKQAKEVFAFSEGLAMYKLDSTFGLIDKTGKVVVNPQFEYIRPFKEGLAAVCKNDKWGFIDKTGKIVINFQFDAVLDFHNGKAVIRNNSQCGFIDKKGSYVINPQFDLAFPMSEGMASILTGKQFGFIGEDGKIMINPQFDEAYSFKNGMALIKQNEKYGFIDKQGKIVINPQFDRATMFFGDITFVRSGDKWGIIDVTGKYVVNPQFDEMKLFENELELELDFGRCRFPSVKTDYYDVTNFISKFMVRVKNNMFDGFNSNSTLQDIVNNTIYGECINAINEYTTICRESQNITNDVALVQTSFYFLNPIYNMVSDGWYNNTQQYIFSEKVSAISYEFSLSNNAEGKGGAIANGLKVEIEKRYGVKLESIDGNYVVFQEKGKQSFAIVYNETRVALCIGFAKEKVQELLTKKNNQDETNN